jgi:hypothetical protein
MTSFKITRTGHRPLAFTGEMIASLSTRELAGHDHNRWHDLRLFRTSAGRFVIAVNYRTQWERELDHDTAQGVATAEELDEFLSHHDIEARVTGLPTGEQFDLKRRRILDDLTNRYHDAVSQILEGFPEHID